jgi:hypothetical protein
MKDEQKVYDEFFDQALHLLNDHQFPVELIAGTMIAIAQRLYKTHLSKEDYKQLMEEIINYPDVEPYEVKKVRIH